MYRTEHWKLVRDVRKPGRDELYNLKRDPDETNNVISSDRPEVQSAIDQLHTKILDKMKAIDDPMLEQIKN